MSDPVQKTTPAQPWFIRLWEWCTMEDYHRARREASRRAVEMLDNG